jgi:hypothetical protein
MRARADAADTDDLPRHVDDLEPLRRRRRSAWSVARYPRNCSWIACSDLVRETL